MRRWEYSKTWKTAAVILNQICAVVLVLSVIVCTMFVGTRGFGWPGRDQGFESTEYYQNEVLEQIYRCIRAASRESKFEKQGIYDGSLLVNVEEYAESSTILDGDPAEGGLDYRLMVLPDHPTPIRLRTHTAESVPYLIYDSTNVQKNNWSYNEAEAILSGNYFSEGPLLMDHFLGLKQPSYRL